MNNLTKEQHEIIEGSLLGDGFIEYRNKIINKATFKIKRKTEDLEYLNWQYEKLKFLITDSGIKSYSRFDRRTNKTYYFSTFSTKSNGLIFDYYQRWYKDGVKLVPKDLDLSPLTMAIWFCDDGSIKYKNNQLEVNFATNGFSISDVEFLIDKLQKRYKEYFYLSMHKNKPTIYASTYASILLARDIDLVFPKGMERKIKWKNISLHDKMHSHTFKDINYTYLILKILKDNILSCKEIIKQFNCIFTTSKINNNLLKMTNKGLITPIGVSDRNRLYKITDDGIKFLENTKNHNLLII